MRKRSYKPYLSCGLSVVLSGGCCHFELPVVSAVLSALTDRPRPSH